MDHILRTTRSPLFSQQEIGISVSEAVSNLSQDCCTGNPEKSRAKSNLRRREIVCLTMFFCVHVCLCSCVSVCVCLCVCVYEQFAETSGTEQRAKGVRKSFEQKKVGYLASKG